MTRQQMRLEARRARRAISAIRAAEMSVRVAQAVVSLPEFISARRIICYSNLPEEVQTGGLMSAVWDCGKELYLPVVREDGGLSAVRCLPSTALEADAMGIMTPTEGETLPPEELDLVIAPGLAFDRLGHRLGFGKGYFDRFLSGCRCPVVGLAYEVQVFDRVHTGPHDIPVDRLVTEERVYDCAAARAAQGEE